MPDDTTTNVNLNIQDEALREVQRQIEDGLESALVTSVPCSETPSTPRSYDRAGCWRSWRSRESRLQYSLVASP